MKFGRVGASLSFVFKERESNNTTSAMDLTERIDEFYPYHVALSHHNWVKAFRKLHLNIQIWSDSLVFSIFFYRFYSKGGLISQDGCQITPLSLMNLQKDA